MAQHTYSLIPSYHVGGQFAQNILHYQFDDSGFTDTASAALALCNAFDTGNTAHLRALTLTTTQILSYKARALTAPGGFEAVKILGAIFGTRAGNIGASAVSPVIVLFPMGNAAPRGRVFLPGVSDTDLVDGEYTSNFRTNVTNHRIMFTQTLTLTGGGSPVATPVIYSRKTTPGSSYTVEYARLSDMPGTQRRRMRPA